MDFSVIVPTFNRPEHLRGLLDSLAALDYPRDRFEVVVVDDGGTSPGSNAVTGGRFDVDVRVIAQANAGPGAARNSGARIARGRWLAFTDDDCRPRSGWLAELKTVLEQGHDVLAGGRTINGLAGNSCSEASQFIADAAYRYFNPDPAHARFLASNNMAVSRAAFLEAGGFDESFRIASEDRDLCDRWTWRGGRIAWTADAVVEHWHDMTLGGFLRQHYRYGRGAARHCAARAARGTGGLTSDLSFRWRWRDLLAPAVTSDRRLALLGLLACWQAANTAGFVHEWLAARLPTGDRRRRRALEAPRASV